MKLRVGTRRSNLARTQTRQTMEELARRCPEVSWEPVEITTMGDKILDRPLREVGGKGLFLKELDEALLDGRIDCAVHSMKDVPTDPAEGTVLAAVLERFDARDVLVTRGGDNLSELRAPLALGTTSLRRQAQCLAAVPGARARLLRGNVETRLRKLADGECDATFLAAAGLQRLGFSLAADGRVVVPEGSTFEAVVYGHRLDPSDFVPAVGQGTIVVSARSGDDATIAALERLEAPHSRLAAVAERAFARVFGGGCHLPVAAYAVADEDGLELRGLLVSPDGQRLLREDVSVVFGGRTHPERLEQAEGLGDSLGRSFFDRGAADILALADAAEASSAGPGGPA